MNWSMPSKTIVRTVGLLLAVGILAGCAHLKPASNQNGKPSAPAAAAADAKEAPALAQLVAQGKLPKLEERLPKKPVVVKPADRIGTYGGSWRMGLRGKSDTQLLTRTVGYENAVRWATDYKSVEPGFLERWEVSADAKSYTFYIREGLKWSDGHPVTADDMLFWGNDVLVAKELTPTIASFFQPSGQVVKVSKIDTYTVRLDFAAPYGLFIQRITHPSAEMIRPAHYLKQFVPKYNKEFVEQEVKRRGLPDVTALWSWVSSPWENPELPVLNAWVVKQGLSSGQTALFERNPYYWKVDPQGHQLPYLDRVVVNIVEDDNALVLKALNGEIDWQERNLATPANKAVFVDGMQRGNYSLTELTLENDNVASIHVNMAHKDPEMRKIFQDKRFRVALSHAINRQEIISTLFLGQGEPWQNAPLANSPFYDAEWAKQYTEYDVAKANQLLDEMGLTARDSRGMRLRLDGKPFLIVFDVSNTGINGVNFVDLVEMVSKSWKAVGVDVLVKPMDRSLLMSRKAGNDHDAGIWSGGMGIDTTVYPLYHMPYTIDSIFAIPWANWISTKGKSGDEPPAIIKQQAEIYWELEKTTDRVKQIEREKELLKISKEQFYTIGISTMAPSYAIRRNDFFNVPNKMVLSFIYPTPGPLNPCTFFTTRVDK